MAIIHRRMTQHKIARRQKSKCFPWEEDEYRYDKKRKQRDCNTNTIISKYKFNLVSPGPEDSRSAGGMEKGRRKSE